MDSLPLIVAGVVVPLMAFVGNIVLRAGRGVAQSAASDLLLLVLVFDASVVIASDEFRPLIRDAALSAQLVAIHVGLWWLGLVAWLLAVLGAETKFAASFDPRLKRYDSRFPLWTWLFSWVLAMAIVFLHVSVFTQEAAAMGDVVTTVTVIAIANAILLPLVAYGCVRLGLLPGVTWYWPFQRQRENPAPRQEPRQRAAALGRRPGTP